MQFNQPECGKGIAPTSSPAAQNSHDAPPPQRPTINITRDLAGKLKKVPKTTFEAESAVPVNNFALLSSSRPPASPSTHAPTTQSSDSASSSGRPNISSSTTYSSATINNYQNPPSQIHAVNNPVPVNQSYTQSHVYNAPPTHAPVYDADVQRKGNDSAPQFK